MPTPTFTHLFSAAIDSIGSVLFPHTCPVCGTLTENGWADSRLEPVCRACLKILSRTEHAVQRGNLSEDHFSRHPRFIRSGAFLFYKDEHVRQLVERFKYGRQPEIAYQLGREAALEWQYSSFFDDIDLIVPVPLHPRRLRERGYNQSEQIARGLRDVLGIPLSADNLLRVRNNPKQALKTGKERKENVRDVFSVQHPELFSRRHILLVDDVVTTGSTLRACMEALRSCRACRISIFTLAIA